MKTYEVTMTVTATVLAISEDDALDLAWSGLPHGYRRLPFSTEITER